MPLPKLLQATPHPGDFPKKSWTVALHLVWKTSHIIKKLFLSLQSFWENNNGFPQKKKNWRFALSWPQNLRRVFRGVWECKGHGFVKLQCQWVSNGRDKTFWAQITLWHWECYGLRERSGHCGFPQRVTYMDKCFG